MQRARIIGPKNEKTATGALFVRMCEIINELYPFGAIGGHIGCRMGFTAYLFIYSKVCFGRTEFLGPKHMGVDWGK